MKVIKIVSEPQKKKKLSYAKKPKKPVIESLKTVKIVNKDLVWNWLNTQSLHEDDLKELTTMIENNDVIGFSSGYATLIKFDGVAIWIKAGIVTIKIL